MKAIGIELPESEWEKFTKWFYNVEQLVHVTDREVHVHAKHLPMDLFRDVGFSPIVLKTTKPMIEYFKAHRHLLFEHSYMLVAREGLLDRAFQFASGTTADLNHRGGLNDAFFANTIHRMKLELRDRGTINEVWMPGAPGSPKDMNWDNIGIKPPSL